MSGRKSRVRKTRQHRTRKHRHYRRKTHRRKTHKHVLRGGNNTHTNSEINQKYATLKQNTQNMTLDTYDDIHNKAVALQNEAARAGDLQLAQQIQGYIHGVINQKEKKLRTQNITPTEVSVYSNIETPTEGVNDSNNDILY